MIKKHRITSDFVCQYEGCKKIDTPILVTDKRRRTRTRFCCAEHAAFYLLRGYSLATMDRIIKESLR